MNAFKRFLSLILIAVLIVSIAPMIPAVSAEGTSYQLADLLKDGKIKPLGRTAVNPEGTGIMCDWPGNGFQMNVSGNGGKLEIGMSSTYDVNWAVLVDGQQVYWQRLAKDGSTISATIPAGAHTVTVVKESDTTAKDADFCDLTTMTFDGTIEAKPANKGLTTDNGIGKILIFSAHFLHSHIPRLD